MLKFVTVVESSASHNHIDQLGQLPAPADFGLKQAMQVTINAIQFNHAPPLGTAAALTIRKNETSNVTVPEWQCGQSQNYADSPAAYAISQVRGKILTIRAQFKRDNLSVPSVDVYAVKNTSSVLGAVESRSIQFQPDQFFSEFEPFNLDGVQLENVGVGAWNIAWDWYFLLNSHATPTLITTTKHRIYALVSGPNPPWGQQGSDYPGYQVPWTEVLDHACQWAAGAKTEDDVAAKITTKVYDLGSSGIQYDDPGSGSSHFTIPNTRTFKCTAFIALLNGQRGARAFVNCDDCASFLACFANILGGDLWESRIASKAPTFNTNPIRKIGFTTQSRENFKYHEVAWKFPCDKAAPLFDCCLQVDGDSNPRDGDTDDHFLPTLGINVVLGDETDKNYHFRLISDDPSGRLCKAQCRTKIQRNIGGNARRRQINHEREALLMDEYDFSSWQNLRTSSQNIFLLNSTLNRGRFSSPGWLRTEIEGLKGDVGAPNVTDAIWQPIGKGDETALRVLSYECASLTAAHSFLLNLLGEFQLAGIERRYDFKLEDERVTIGDVAFAGPEDLVLLFARANVVFLIQNAKPSVVPCSRFAGYLDADVLINPDFTGEKLIKMERLTIPKGRFRVGDEIPIQPVHHAAENHELLYRFFSASGEVSVRDDQLVYYPATAGLQFINAFALQASQELARQQLSVLVEPAESLRSQIDRNKKRRKAMTTDDIKGPWASIQPRPDESSTSTDMSPNGLIEIKTVENGQITGYYTDLFDRTTVPLEGYVIYGPQSYFFHFYHELNTANYKQRVYEGTIVQEDNTPIYIVAGRWQNIKDPQSVTPKNGTSSASTDGQEEGIWIATKP